MNKMEALSRVAACLLTLLAACATSSHSHPPNVVTVHLTGENGTAIRGYYVQNAKRVDVAENLPWLFEASGVTEFEFRKVDLEDTVIVDARFTGAGTNLSLQSVAGPGAPGVRGQVRRGLTIGILNAP